MKIPLSARALINDGVQLIEVWNNGKSEIVKSPILPYVYSKTQLPQANCSLINGYSLLSLLLSARRCLLTQLDLWRIAIQVELANARQFCKYRQMQQAQHFVE